MFDAFSVVYQTLYWRSKQNGGRKEPMVVVKNL